MHSRDLDRFSTLFWGPWNEFDRLQSQLGHVFDGFAGSNRTRPPINVWTKEDAVMIRAQLPGFDPESLDISVHGRTLTLGGQRKPHPDADGVRYHRQERATGDFLRTVALPYDVENEQVSARFENGILEISLPRSQAQRPRRIEILNA